MDSVLTAARVEEVFIDCLYKESEHTDNAIVAEGIVTTAGFHPERLESHRKDIEAMLAELPSEFQQAGGGGMSFLQACVDKNGNQWTGEHRTMEHLFQLGIGIGKVECLVPRKMWSAFPGGMPYYVVN